MSLQHCGLVLDVNADGALGILNLADGVLGCHLVLSHVDVARVVRVQRWLLTFQRLQCNDLATRRFFV